MSALRAIAGLDVAIATGIGDRAEQQDAGAAGQVAAGAGVLLTLADGMGGMEGGREAALTAVRRLPTHFRGFRLLSEVRRMQFDAAFSSTNVDVCKALRGALGGCALTSAYVRGGAEPAVWFAHCGDVAGMIVRPMGGGKAEVHHRTIAHRARRNALSRFVGDPFGTSPPDVSEGLRVREGDWIVLATDGITDVLAGDVLSGLFDTGARAQVVADHLVALALSLGRAGKRDNATCVLARVTRAFVGPVAAPA